MKLCSTLVHHLVDVTFGALKLNATFDGRFGNLNQKDKVYLLPTVGKKVFRSKMRRLARHPLYSSDPFA